MTSACLANYELEDTCLKKICRCGDWHRDEVVRVRDQKQWCQLGICKVWEAQGKCVPPAAGCAATASTHMHPEPAGQQAQG